MLLLQNRHAFQDISIPFPDIVTLNSLADKCSLMALAESLDIPIPKTRHLNNTSMLSAASEDLDYPIILKPGMSWLNSKGKWFRSSVRSVRSRSEAEDIVTADPAFSAGPFLIQEYVEGKGQGVFALYDHGEPLAFFSHKRLREKPPSGGVSVLSESVPAVPALLSYARRVLDHAPGMALQWWNSGWPTMASPTSWRSTPASGAHSSWQSMPEWISLAALSGGVRYEARPGEQFQDRCAAPLAARRSRQPVPDTQGRELYVPGKDRGGAAIPETGTLQNPP